MNPSIHIGKANINKEDDEQQKFSSLPDQLIVDMILPRLPVKSLLRFKSVCTDWSSVTATPEFAKSQLASSRPRHQFLLLVEDHARVEHPNYRMFQSVFKYGNETCHLYIAGCCNGLVGFTSRVSKTTIYIVLNPATGQRVEIIGPADGDFTKSACDRHWFGYVSSVDDYKIVSFRFWDDAFWTFSRNNGLWKRTSCCLQKHVKTILVGRPTLINDSLYWPITKFNIGGPIDAQIVKLNLVNEECEVMPCMSFTYPVRNLNLFIWKGCLGLHTTSYHGHIEVWVLRQNSDWNSWEKIYSKGHRYLELVYISTTGKLLVQIQKGVADPEEMLVQRTCLMVVDDLSQLRREEESHGSQDKITLHCILSKNLGDYVESLMWPF